MPRVTGFRKRVYTRVLVASGGVAVMSGGSRTMWSLGMESGGLRTAGHKCRRRLEEKKLQRGKGEGAPWGFVLLRFKYIHAVLWLPIRVTVDRDGHCKQRRLETPIPAYSLQTL